MRPRTSNVRSTRSSVKQTRPQFDHTANDSIHSHRVRSTAVSGFINWLLNLHWNPRYHHHHSKLVHQPINQWLETTVIGSDIDSIDRTILTRNCCTDQRQWGNREPRTNHSELVGTARIFKWCNDWMSDGDGDLLWMRPNFVKSDKFSSIVHNEKESSMKSY